MLLHNYLFRAIKKAYLLSVPKKYLKIIVNDLVKRKKLGRLILVFVLKLKKLDKVNFNLSIMQDIKPYCTTQLLMNN